MNVQELIEILSNFDQNTEVFVRMVCDGSDSQEFIDTEGEFNDSNITTKKLTMVGITITDEQEEPNLVILDTIGI